MLLGGLGRLAATLLVLQAAHVVGEVCPVNFKPDHAPPKVADGWAARVVAHGLKQPRGIVIDQSGALLIADEGVGIKRVTFDDKGGTCLVVKETQELVKDPEINHGIVLSKDSLYASTPNNVYQWPYKDGTLGERRTLVTNMTNSAGHSSRTLLLSRDESSLLVSRGSAGNIDHLALDKASGRCQIRQFQTASPPSEPYNYPRAGRLVGWGLRNSVGVAEHPDGGVWSVENSVDNLKRRGVDIHQDNPAEELNYHSKISDTNEGGNHGYPSCFALWATKDVPEIGNLTTGDHFAADTETSTSSVAPTDQQCNTDFVEPVLAFQAHTAPLDIKFDEGGNTAYISFHGSWNRNEKVGYEVAALDFENGRPKAEHSSRDAIRSILSNVDVSQCPSKCFRPVGLAWDPKGRLWMSSDSTGDVYVLLKGKDPWDSSGARLSPALLAVLGAVTLALAA